jgi:3-dehydroquinate synthase
MKNISLKIKDSAYDIKIGSNVVNKENLEILSQENEVLVVFDGNLTDYDVNLLKDSLSPELPKLNFIKIAASEENKSIETLNEIHTILIEKKYSRDCLVIGMGGGIVCDITGFAAATFQRGVKFILIPTTLLSQVDASVGGKTAINHSLGKNMIGAFHQPSLVLADTQFLKSLPKREIGCGLSEMIKHGLIQDYEYFSWIEKNIESLLNLDEDALENAISKSIEIKANIVSLDEKEQNIRAWLNFGHTFGHALELIGNFKDYNHGEAVAIGMLMAMHLSVELEKIDKKDILRVKNLLEKSNIDLELKKPLNAQTLFECMEGDKKKRGNTLNFIVLEKIGKAVTVNNLDRNNILKAISSTF